MITSLTHVWFSTRMEIIKLQITNFKRYTYKLSRNILECHLLLMYLTYFYFTLIKDGAVRPIASLKFIVGVQVPRCYLRGFSLELVYFGKKTVVTEAWKYCFEKLIANGLLNKDLIPLDKLILF